VSHLIQNIDLVPTLLDAAGVPIPDAVEGRSFWPLLVGQVYQPHEALVIERNHHGDYDPMRAVRTPRYHYIRNFEPAGGVPWLKHKNYLYPDFADWYEQFDPPPGSPRRSEELYDIVSDPYEFVDLSTDPDHAEIRRELAAYLEQWQRETDDPLLYGPIPDRLNPIPAQEVEA
jgi:arylsulfatase A-like enzyme